MPPNPQPPKAFSLPLARISQRLVRIAPPRRRRQRGCRTDGQIKRPFSGRPGDHARQDLRAGRSR